MKAKLRETELYFDIESLGLVPRGAKMAEKPTAFLIHGGPGVDHLSFFSQSEAEFSQNRNSSTNCHGRTFVAGNL